MSNQQAIDEALDQLEIQNEEVLTEELADEVVEVDNQVGETKENPPGYIDNIDDWVASGKDPDSFKGKNAYSAEYERIQEIKELKESMKTVVDGVSEWKEQQQLSMASQLKQARADAVADLQQAKEDDDIDAALNASQKINELDKPKQEVYKPNPVLTEFYSKNPILDENSPHFDAEVFTDAKMFQNVILDGLSGKNNQVKFTNSQIERSLNVALAKAKELSPDKFVSPRNKRKAAPTTARAKINNNGAGYATKLKGVKSNSQNKRDTNAAYEIYEMLKAKSPEAAKTYAKNVLGEQ